MTLMDQMTRLAADAKAASRCLSLMSTADKNRALKAMAEALESSTDRLQQANSADMEVGRQLGLSGAMLDRLQLDPKRIHAMAEGVRQVAELPDPVGRCLDRRRPANGLEIQKITTPIGVVVIIYESRPNVTADAASLCFKSGNACILRGGKEALNSNQLIAQLMIEAAQSAVPGFPVHAIQVVPTSDREAIPALLSLTSLVDLCMPRGGEGLIRAVSECSKVPVIKHYKGVCHVFVDREADPEMAARIAINAKCQRPSTCNAMETLLVDAPVAESFLRRLVPDLAKYGVEIHGDAKALEILKASSLRTRAATDQDFATEYNDYVLNVRVVDGLDAAVSHIAQFGSAHSDSIVTRNEATARRFLSAVDSAAVYWNASTRFTDGGEFGMGAEIGISTDKVGARGPMGLEELTTYKWVVFGNGQIRS